MKYFLCITLFLLLPFQAYAAVASVSATTTPVRNQQVEDLKERLATKVAQLRQSERRALYGKVKATTISTLTIETANKDIKIELTDDIKVFQTVKGKRTTLTIEDVAKDDVVSIFGDWDTTVEVLKAKVIFIHSTNETMSRIIGTVSEAKKADYTISMATQDGKTYTIDFETATKTSVWTKEAGVEKGGFSKLVAGDTILVVGTAVPKKENRISALRILNIGNLTGEKPVTTPEPTKEATSASAKSSPTPIVKP